MLNIAPIAALVIWAPLPWGSVETWAVAVLCGFVFATSASLAVRIAHGRALQFKPEKGLRCTIGIWMVVALYAFLQATVPTGLGAQAAQLYGYTEVMAGTAVTPIISIERHATFLSACLSLAYLLVFCLIVLTVDTRPKLRILAYTIVAAGVAQACYGIFMALSGIDYGFFAPKSFSRGLATGTFVNRNHFAGFLEISLAVGIGLLVGGKRTGSRLVTWRDWVKAIASFFLSVKAPLRIGILIMALALILSRSRMGNSAFLISLSIVGLLFLTPSRGTFRNRMTALWLSILIVDIGFLGSYFGLEELKQRLEATTATEVDNRVDISDHLQPYVIAYQPLGSGLGTFENAFMPYFSQKMRVKYDHAENDYLQFLGELGGIALLLPMLVLGSLLKAARTAARAEHIFTRGIAFGATMGIVAISLHSFVDFNLQIPANGLLFVTLLAFCWLGELPETPTRERRSPLGVRGESRRLRLSVSSHSLP